MIGAVEKTFSFAEFELDTAARRLLKDGQTLALNSKAFDLLTILVKNHGRILSKEELLETVWENQFVEENNLTVHISALRKIFGEQKGENRFIVTVPGKGYKFIAELNDHANGEIIIENHKIEKIVIDEEIEPEQAKLLPPKPRKNIFAFAVAGLLIFGAVAVWFFYNRSTANHAPIESIAVMPFVYEGGNADTEYLSDGMTESLINNLSQLPKLTVKARNSVFRYKGVDFDANKVGADLNVQAILLGRIVERGDDFSLSLELVDAKTNNHLWGEQYTRKKSDLAILQTDIARDVSAKLRRKLANGETLPKGGTTNAEAYQLYLKGRYLWNKRTRESLTKAAALFEQAIALDPNYALAYAGIGDAYTVDFLIAPDKTERIAKGRAAALKALEIAPDLAEAYAVLAKCEWADFNWTEAEKYFKRALEVNPNYASAHQWYGEFLVRQGKTEESLHEISRALELEPLSLIINSDAVYIYAMARQYDRAVRQADRTLELDPNWRQALMWRAITDEYKENFTAALDDYEKENEASEKPEEEKRQTRGNLKEIREALEKSGAEGYWRKWLETEKRRPPKDMDLSFIAILYAALGEREKALDALEKSVEEKESASDLMKVEPHFDSLRNEPRFQTLLRRVGLEP